MGNRPAGDWMRATRRLAATLLTSGFVLLTGSCTGVRPAQPGDVLFQDAFEHASSGWDRYQGADYRADYVDGTYRIEVLLPNTDAWSTPELSFGDAQIEVDARKVAGPDDNLFGVLCRYQDGSNFYFLLISSDGYAGIGIQRQGEARLLTSEAMLPHPAVARGGNLNHLSARCLGTHLELVVNGASVASASAAEWLRGDVGLIAGAYDEPGVVIEFDNFSVLQP